MYTIPQEPKPRERSYILATGVEQLSSACLAWPRQWAPFPALRKNRQKTKLRKAIQSLRPMQLHTAQEPTRTKSMPQILAEDTA